LGFVFAVTLIFDDEVYTNACTVPSSVIFYSSHIYAP